MQTVWRESDRGHDIGVPFQWCADSRSRLCLPNLHSRVMRGRRKVEVIRGVVQFPDKEHVENDKVVRRLE